MSLLSGLLAYYKYDENTGTLVADATGNGHDGTWHGTLGSQWTTGKINSGGNFNSIDNYVAAPFSSGLSGDFTVAAWVNFNSLNPNNMIFMALVPSYNNYWFSISALNTGPRFAFSAALYDGGHNPFVNSIVTPTTNTWYHVGLVRDTSQGKLFLYVNGSLDSSTTDTTVLVPTYTTFEMGLDNGRTGNDRVNGVIDEVPVYGRALNASEMPQLWNSGLAFQYPFIVTSQQTQLGKARIQQIMNQTQLGKSNITATNTQTQLGKARMRTNAFQTQQGKAKLAQGTLPAQQGKASIISAFDIFTRNRDEDYHV